MTQLSLDEAQKQLSEILDKGAKGEEFIIEGDGGRYHINITLASGPQRRERIEGLGGGQTVLYMSEDFTAEDPEINKMFYGES